MPNLEPEYPHSVDFVNKHAGKNSFEAPALDLAAIQRFHVAGDSFLTLHRKPNGIGWENIGGFKVSELEQMFPQVAQSLLEDSFFSVNGHYRQVKRGSSNTLRYLNACYLDLDCYEVKPAEAIGRAVQAMAEDVIPSASIFGLSGRGIWLFWLLRNEQEPDLPPPAFPEKRLLFALMYSTVKILQPYLMKMALKQLLCGARCLEKIE